MRFVSHLIRAEGRLGSDRDDEVPAGGSDNRRGPEGSLMAARRFPEFCWGGIGPGAVKEKEKWKKNERKKGRKEGRKKGRRKEGIRKERWNERKRCKKVHYWLSDFNHVKHSFNFVSFLFTTANTTSSAVNQYYLQ